MHFLSKAYGHLTEINSHLFKAEISSSSSLFIFLRGEGSVFLTPNKDSLVSTLLAHREKYIWARTPDTQLLDITVNVFRFLNILQIFGYTIWLKVHYVALI